MPRPALLPDVRDLDIAISKLPQVGERPTGAVARISEFHCERGLGGD